METKEDANNNLTLALPPVIYTPRLNDGGFVEDFDNPRYSTIVFQTNGIQCNCPSNNTFHNRASFINQHCRGVRHIRYILHLNDNNTRIIEERNEQRKEIRNLRIANEQMRNESLRRERENTERNNKILELSERILELQNENGVSRDEKNECVELLQQLKNECDDIRTDRDEVKRKYTLLTEMIKTFFTDEEHLQFP